MQRKERAEQSIKSPKYNSKREKITTVGVVTRDVTWSVSPPLPIR